MALADTAKLVASLELQDKFSATAAKADAGLGRLEGRINKLGSTAARGLGTLATNLTKVAAVGVGAAAVGLAASVNAASDLNEEIDKSKVVFGPAADELFRFADGAAAIGLSKAEALGAAGAFGNMFNTVGLAQGKSADMSQTMVQLASDMASFNNEDPSDMLDRLRSGLSGEAEPLRRFGVLLSEASVKEFAYRTGIAKSGDALTEAQKVQARYGLILEQTTIQQGNFADTSDSLANQQRTLSANLRNTGATIGQALLPTVGRLAKRINELFIDKQPQIKQFGERIGKALESVFTNKNLEKGMDLVGGFIDKLAKGGDGEGLKTVASSIGGIASEVAGLPWAAIADAAKLLGTGSKALLDAFLGMPAWVQTAVLTGWGLNKLTGGAVGSIVGELSKGLIKGVLGLNAGVVNINAAKVVGPGGGVPGTPTGGGRAGPASLLSTLGIAGIALGIGTAVGTEVHAALLPVEHRFNELVSGTEGRPASLSLTEASIQALSAEIGVPTNQLKGEMIPLLERGDMTYEEVLAAVRKSERTQNQRLEEGNRYASTLNRNTVTVAERAAQQRREGNRYAGGLVDGVRASRAEAKAAAAADATRINALRDSHTAALGTLQQIRDKKSSVHVTVNNTSTIAISASQMATRITQINLTTDSEQWINEAVR